LREVNGTPRGRNGPLESLAIPLTGADPPVAVLQAKIAEARANAAQEVAPRQTTPPQTTAPKQP